MANPRKAKGTRWESDIVKYLRANGFPEARRVVQAGMADDGDIHVRDFVIQAKAYRSIAEGINEGVKGYKIQRVNAGLPYGVSIVKRPGKNVREGYVVMDLEDFTAFLRDYYARPEAPDL